MAIHPVIILKNNKHTPAEAGDTISPSALPISAEQDNGVEIKNDGLFVPVADIKGVSFDVEAAPDTFATNGHKVTHTVTTASGAPTTKDVYTARPFTLGYEAAGNAQHGLSKNRIVLDTLNADGSDKTAEFDVVPNAVIKQPTLDGTTLKIGLEHYKEGTLVDDSYQEVSIDLASLRGTSLVEAQDEPNETTGNEIPTTFFGGAREKLLASPDKWLEITVNGERGVVPWFKLP